MEKKVVLPFEDSPYALMYHYIAFPMGIIQGNAKDDITPWLCGRHINCWFDKEWINQFCVCVSDNYGVSDHIITNETVSVFSESFEDLLGDPLQLFRRMIDIGTYPNGSYNEEFIPGKYYYQKEYYSHDFLLIGYDDIEQQFISVGYLADQQFHRFVIPYANMEQALKTLQSSKMSYTFWMYNPNARFELNLNRIINDLSDYLRSTTSLKIYSKHRTWGMGAIEELANMFSKAEKIDPRYTRGLMEHKFFMQMRMNYLFEHGYLNKKSYCSSSAQIYKMAESVRMLSLKYSFTKNRSIVDKICEIIREMQRLEAEYLPDVLNDLCQYKKGK